MAAPDKIYVDCGLIDYHSLDKQRVNGIEYICKKTMMAWANRYITAINKEPNADGYAGRAAKAVLTDLIEKLNSM